MVRAFISRCVHSLHISFYTFIPASMKVDFDIIGWLAGVVAELRPTYTVQNIAQFSGKSYVITFTEVHNLAIGSAVTVAGCGEFNTDSAIVINRTATTITLQYKFYPVIPATFGTVSANTPTFRHFETFEVDNALAELTNMNKAYPVIGLIEPVTWDDTIKPSAQIDSNYNIQMLFVLPADYTNNSALKSNHWINAINPMSELAYMFISAVRSRENVENVSVIPRFESLKNYPAAANKVTGVLLRLAFRLQNIKNIC
jgi:hypothetical protein